MCIRDRRRLSEEGRFEEFKEKFEEEYGDPWESSRQDFYFIQDSVVDVLSDMDFMSESAARNWCEKGLVRYRENVMLLVVFTSVPLLFKMCIRDSAEP